jgi:bifunctional DNA-binding transcriptional regulator/antitoxin component of YhaV-PrlF toxin-antitoxin module
MYKEIRKVQALQGERNLTIILPKTYASQLGIGKGDFLRITVEGTKLIMERATV